MQQPAEGEPPNSTVRDPLCGHRLSLQLRPPGLTSRSRRIRFSVTSRGQMVLAPEFKPTGSAADAQGPVRTARSSAAGSHLRRRVRCAPAARRAGSLGGPRGADQPLGPAHADRRVRRSSADGLRSAAAKESGGSPSSARMPVSSRSGSWSCCRAALVRGPLTSWPSRHSYSRSRTRRTHCSCR